MNKDSMPKIVRLDEKELEKLTKEVKETVAKDLAPLKRKKRNFTEAQMWSRRRRMRSASLRIRL